MTNMFSSRDRSVVRSSVIPPVREILLLGVVAQVDEGQDDDRQAWRCEARGSRSGGVPACCRQAGYAFRAKLIGPHWPCDVLDLLLADILEGVIELVPHLITNDPANADPARLGQGLQSSSDVDAVAEDVLLLN